MAAAIPEVPLAKRRDQRGIAKIAVFAYHRETGMPVWQSGIAHQESSANDVWILGAGPFQRGTIYDGTAFAGNAIRGEDAQAHERISRHPAMDLARERTFTSPQQLAKQPPAELVDHGVVPAVHQEPVSAAPAPATSAPPAANAPASIPLQGQLPKSVDDSRNQTRGALTAQVHDSTISHATGALYPTTNVPHPVGQIPLPMPRLNSPQP